MKVVLAGAFGNLGAEILKSLCRDDHTVVAADLKERPVSGTEGKYTFVPIDATDPETLHGLCDGADAVVTTMGLTGASTRFTAYDIDYNGNMNLYTEAKRAGVKKFHYISVISCDEPGAEKVPMLHAKYLMEQEIKKQPMDWVIYRPTGYFYDICKVFKPYVDKGEMQLLKGYGGVKANVVDCADFADFIVAHLDDANVVYVDRKGTAWARRDGAASARYSYPMQEGFYCPSLGDNQLAVGEDYVGWMNCVKATIWSAIRRSGKRALPRTSKTISRRRNRWAGDILGSSAPCARCAVPSDSRNSYGSFRSATALRSRAARSRC